MMHSQYDSSKGQYRRVEIEDPSDPELPKLNNNGPTMAKRICQLYDTMKAQLTCSFSNIRKNLVISSKDKKAIAIIIIILFILAGSYLISQFIKKQIPLQLAQFCIITPKASGPTPNYQRLLKSLTQQSYSNWTLAISYMPQDQDKRKIWTKNLDRKKFKLYRSSGNRGQDIYKIVTSYCSNHSFTVILDLNQTLHSPDTLKQLSLNLSDPNVGALVLPYQQNKSLKSVSYEQIMSLSRQQSFPFNKYKISEMQRQFSRYSDFIKIFKTSIFRKISIYDLMNFKTDQFFESSISFLLPIVQMLNQTVQDTPNANNNIKKIQEQSDFNAKEKMLFGDVPLFQIEQSQKIQFKDSQLIQIGHLNKYSSLSYIYSKLLQKYGIIPEFLRKDRTQYNIYSKIPLQQGMPMPIPSKIHFIQLDTELNTQRQKIIMQTMATFKDHQVKLWRSQDVNIQDFPTTTNFRRKLQNIQLPFEEERYWISSILRMQILSKEGGFYFDSNYQAITNLTEFKQYNLVGTIENPWQLGQSISCKFFGVSEDNKFISKLLSDISLSRLLNEKIKLQKDYTCDKFLASAFTMKQYAHIKILPSTLFLSFSEESQDKRLSESVCVGSQYKLGVNRPEALCQGNYGFHHQFMPS